MTSPLPSRAPGWGLCSGVVVALGLSACAHMNASDRVSQANAELAAKAESSQVVAELHKEPLPVLKPMTYAMDGTRPVFRVGEGKSYVLAFELPRFDRPYSITVSSLTQGAITDSWLFVPRVTLMDERSVVTRTFPEDSLRTRGRAVERTVFINPSNAAERYLLVHAAPLSSAYVRDVQMVVTQTYSSGPMIAHWTSGADVKATTRSAPIGEVEVSVEGLTPPAR